MSRGIIPATETSIPSTKAIQEVAPDLVAAAVGWLERLIYPVLRLLSLTNVDGLLLTVLPIMEVQVRPTPRLLSLRSSQFYSPSAVYHQQTTEAQDGCSTTLGRTSPVSLTAVRSKLRQPRWLGDARARQHQADDGHVLSRPAQHAAGCRAHRRDVGLKGSIRTPNLQRAVSWSSKVPYVYAVSQDVVIASQVQGAE
jgi:hypothetical protein